MKLLSSYIKEMKIAARGFYFYIEVGFAVILLLILLVAVNESSVSKNYEFLYYDMSDELFDVYYSSSIEDGLVEVSDNTSFEAKALSFEVINEETDTVTSYDFDKTTYDVKTYKMYDKDTGEFNKYLYITDTEEAMIHLSYTEKKVGATTRFTDDYVVEYDYFIQGFETQRLRDLMYVLHNESQDVLMETINSIEVRKLGEVEILNNRENLVPVMIVFLGSLMGFFIVMAYIFLDKAEGVIRAFAVTPSSVWKYLLSKIMVITTTVLVSSSIIAIPVMGLQPNYLLFYLLLIVTTFAFAALGLLVASYFDSISKSFGVLYGTMIALMIPAFSYFIPSFDPVWLRFFPTYPMLQGFKEIIMVNTDVGYVLAYSGVFLVSGLILFLLANIRFKKTLTV